MNEIRLCTPRPTSVMNVTALSATRMLFSSINEIPLLMFRPTSAEDVAGRSGVKMLCSDISDIRRMPDDLPCAREILLLINSSPPFLTSIIILLRSRRTNGSASVDVMDGDETILMAMMRGSDIGRLWSKNSTHGTEAITTVFSRGKLCAQSSK